MLKPKACLTCKVAVFESQVTGVLHNVSDLQPHVCNTAPLFYCANCNQRRYFRAGSCEMCGQGSTYTTWADLRDAEKAVERAFEDVVERAALELGYHRSSVYASEDLSDELVGNDWPPIIYWAGTNVPRYKPQPESSKRLKSWI